jgi:hypothetical protein
MENVGTLGRSYSFFTPMNTTDIFTIAISEPSSEAPLDPMYEAVLSTVRFSK